MNTVKRVLVGSAGNSAGIALTFAQRLLITPIVLSSWNAEQYGFYLALAAIIGLITLPGRSYENIINREFLRIGDIFPKKLLALHGGGVIISGILETVIAILVYGIAKFTALISPESANLISGNEMLIASSVFFSRVFNSFPGSTFSGLLSCYGYYPKLIWLSLIGKTLAVIIPCVGVLSGLGPIGVTVLDLTAPCLFTIPAWLILRKWAIKSKVWGWAPNTKQAYRMLVFSFQNLITEGIMMVRGEGLRIILSAFSGSVSLAAFATMRTGANLALQGLATFTGPLMPEMMRFVREKKSDKIESVFCSIWIPLIILVCPAITVLQIFVAPFFSAWTRGKVQFDPLLFAMLSSSVIFYALSQPSASVLSGNNLLRQKLIVSIISSCVILATVFISVPKIGLVAAAVALLLGEITAYICNEWFARRWFVENDLVWPKRILRDLLPVATITTGGLIALAMIDSMPVGSDYLLIRCMIVTAVLGIACFSCLRLYLRLPILLRIRMNPFLRKRFPQVEG